MNKKATKPSAWFNAVCAESGHHLQFQTCHVAVVRDAGGNTLGIVMTNGTEWTVEKQGMSACSPTPTPHAGGTDA